MKGGVEGDRGRGGEGRGIGELSGAVSGGRKEGMEGGREGGREPRQCQLVVPQLFEECVC